ncbi:hypothetical protein L6R52_17380 [Myxococcota bacterium]|nr:hypothetical protein [Myxococcota bacterium]
MDRPSTTLDALRRALHRTDGAGRALFTPEQLAHLVPFVLLAGAAGLVGRPLSDRVATYLGALGATLGLGPDATADAIADAAGAYYARFPVHPALYAEVRAAITDHDGTERWSDAARALVELLEEPEATRWLPSREDAAHRISAGPLARAALDRALPSTAPRDPAPKRPRRRKR